MIKVGKMNESIGMTQDDWKQEDPGGYDEDTVGGYIRNFDYAAKALKCKAKDLIQIVEEENFREYNAIIKKIPKDAKDVRVKMPDLDGLAGLWTLTNGYQIVTTNEWGFGTIFIKKSELKKAMNESVDSVGEAINEALKPAKIGWYGNSDPKLPDGSPELFGNNTALELSVLGDDGKYAVAAFMGEEGEMIQKTGIKDKNTAVKLAEKLLKEVNNDMYDPRKVAKKYGMDYYAAN